MSTRLYFLKSCARCGGDLIFDEGDLRCWQCGHYYYKTPAIFEVEPRPQPREEQVSSEPQGIAAAHTNGSAQEEVCPRRRGRRKGYGVRASRNIDAVIRAKETSDARWWTRNRQIIEYLDQGLSIRKIASLAERGERQIRVVRERLIDLRQATSEREPSRNE